MGSQCCEDAWRTLQMAVGEMPIETSESFPNVMRTQHTNYVLAVKVTMDAEDLSLKLLDIQTTLTSLIGHLEQPHSFREDDEIEIKHFIKNIDRAINNIKDVVEAATGPAQMVNETSPATQEFGGAQPNLSCTENTLTLECTSIYVGSLKEESELRFELSMHGVDLLLIGPAGQRIELHIGSEELVKIKFHLSGTRQYMSVYTRPECGQRILQWCSMTDTTYDPLSEVESEQRIMVELKPMTDKDIQTVRTMCWVLDEAWQDVYEEEREEREEEEMANEKEEEIKREKQETMPWPENWTCPTCATTYIYEDGKTFMLE